MQIPERVLRQQGQRALVDGIPFELPVVCAPSPVLMAAFTIDGDKAAALLPGKELFPVRLLNGRAVLLVAVIDYQQTTIGKYIEFNVGIGCTHGEKPAPAIVPGLLTDLFGTGQFVLDLPVSTEISVKGGKGIWGMPKHQANLDFTITDRSVSSQYDLDGQSVLAIDIEHPGEPRLPVRMKAANYCAFRGMLMKSTIYFTGEAAVRVLPRAAGSLRVGTHPRLQVLRDLDVAPEPIMTAFLPAAQGTLDDHIEAWFLHYDTLPSTPPEGLESVVTLGLGQEWLPAPVREAV
ncbi:MAG: acetoacetate decarboxylase family protein [Vicinamibacterales bacterium]